MTDTNGIDDIDDLLWRARITGRPICPNELGDLSEPQAYEVQRRTASRLVAAGDHRLGWKVGLTTPGAGGPIRGTLLASAKVRAGTVINTAGLQDPHIEGEVMFVMRDELRGPGVTTADVLAAAHGLGSAIEVFAGRVAPPPTMPAHMVADNSSAAYFIPGPRTVPVDQIDLASISLRLLCGGDLRGCGAASRVMGNPARAVAWLANYLAVEDEALRPRDVVLSGSATGAHPVRGGDSWELEAAQRGSITVAFA